MSTLSAPDSLSSTYFCKLSQRPMTRSTPSFIDFKTRLACFLSGLPPFAPFALFFAAT
jgi:hypothetical protein